MTKFFLNYFPYFNSKSRDSFHIHRNMSFFVLIMTVMAYRRYGMNVSIFRQICPFMHSIIGQGSLYDKSQLICIVGSGVPHLFPDNTPLILYLVWVRQVGLPIKHSNTMVSKPVTSKFSSVDRCKVMLEKKISISTKLVSRWKHKAL